MKTILVTGGSGFIGRNVIEYFKNSDKYVILHPDSKELNCIVEDSVYNYLKNNKIDIVLNFAVYGDGIDKQKDGSKILEYNLRMYYNFSKYNYLYKKMIYAGSGAEYDKRFPICSVREEDIGKTIPVDQYGLMKYIVGRDIERSSNIYNLRLFGIFGKYEYYPVKFISNICCKSILGIPLTIRQNVYFDYLWIDDFLLFLEKFIETENPKYHSYNVVSGKRIDLYKLCTLVNDCAGRTSDIIICREGLANEYTASNNRIMKEYPDFKVTPIEESICQLYDWYLNHKKDIDLYKLIY